MHHWTWICTIALFAACGDAHEDDHAHGHDPLEHACEQADLDGTSVIAADARENAPEIAPSEETPYTVTLAPGQSSWLKIAGGIEVMLFTKTAGVVKGVFHEQSTDNLLAAPQPNDRCPNDVPERFIVPLDRSGSYYVELATGTTPSVWLALAINHSD